MWTGYLGVLFCCLFDGVLLMAKKEVWDRPNPKGKSKRLTNGVKASAKASARRGGRVYPNLVDNMRASQRD
jgi:hypothetical protein